MAWSIPEIAPLKAPQGTHLVLAVGVPALFWNLTAFWLTGTGPSWPSAPLGLAYALVLGFWAPWRQRTKQGPLLKLWVWLMASLLLYGSLAWVEGLPWPRTLGMEGYHLLWFLFGFLQGQLTALWAGQLTPRARLYQLIEGVPPGRQLEERVHDFQLDADFSKANEAALTGSLAVLAVLVVLMATFSPYGREGLSPLLGGAFLVLCLMLTALLRTYRREMEALVYGRRYSLAEKWAPLGWTAVLIALALGAAWGLMALGGPWVDWEKLGQGRHEALPPAEADPVDPLTQRPPVEGGDYRLAVLVALLQRIFRFQNLLALVEWTVRLISWAAPFAFAAFLIWPLVRWVLSGGRETKGLGRRWWQLLKAQWREFLAALAGWWRKPAAQVPDLTAASGAGEWIRSLFQRPRRSDRKPYPEVVEAFLALARWAEPVTTYQRGETTREYLDRLATLLPPSSQRLAEVRDLLDRELFSARGLDAAGRRDFLAVVTALTSAPPSHDGPQGVS